MGDYHKEIIFIISEVLLNKILWYFKIKDVSVQLPVKFTVFIRNFKEFQDKCYWLYFLTTSFIKSNKGMLSGKLKINIIAALSYIFAMIMDLASLTFN